MAAWISSSESGWGVSCPGIDSRGAELSSADDDILDKNTSYCCRFPEENCVWVCFQYTMQTHKEKTCCFRYTKTQKASDGAAVEDCPGGAR